MADENEREESGAQEIVPKWMNDLEKRLLERVDAVSGKVDAALKPAPPPEQPKQPEQPQTPPATLDASSLKAAFKEALAEVLNPPEPEKQPEPEPLARRQAPRGRKLRFGKRRQ